MKKNYSILFAEDNANVRKNYMMFLKGYCDMIYEAEDGLEALIIYKDKKPSILILDITMPKVNGLDLIQEIRKTDKVTPIIILSAHSNKEYLLKAIKLNLIEYLIKPVDRQTLLNSISNALKSIENVTNHYNISEKIEICDECYWDSKASIMFFKKKIIDLTKNEILLFKLFLANKNQILTPSDIGLCVWNSNRLNKNDVNVRNLVKRLRKKLPVQLIQSIYGNGYILSLER